MTNILLPILFAIILLLSLIKKKNAYDSFTKGAKNGINLIIDIMPYIITIMLMISFMQICGLTSIFVKLFTPIFSFLGVPHELIELICMRPFSNSGSLSILNDILMQYNANSYIGRCACLIMSCTETVFFVTTIYGSKKHFKNYAKIIILALSISFLSMVLACNLCKLIF